jgi:phosphoesterase RecJ-like protein
LINESSNILLLSHESPDGDAIGSLMGFYIMLKNLNKKVDVVVPEMPETFLFLDSIDEVLTESNKKYDLGIVLDCASRERIGQNNNEFANCEKSIVIDHHTSNREYGDINYVIGEASSCCQVLYYLFKYWNVKITIPMGEALLTGLLTDTSGFKNNNVDKNSLLMSAELIELGVDFHKVYYLVLSKKNMAQYLLMKMSLERLELIDEGRIAFSPSW